MVRRGGDSETMKKLEKVNADWVDRNNADEKFEGKMERDLEKGDKFITRERGKKIEYTVIDKVVTEEGYVKVISQGVEVQ